MKFLKKLWERIKALYLNLRPDTKHAIIVAIEVTSKLNNFVQSASADVLTAIIPGTLDDRMKEKLRIILPEVLKALKLAETGVDNPEAVILEAIKRLKELEGDAKSGILHVIAAMITRKLTQIKWSDTVAVVEYKYQS